MFVILFSATNKLALIKGQVYRYAIVRCEVVVVKQFMLGLVVALVCSTTAAAEGFWVCKLDNSKNPEEEIIVNLHVDRMVLVTEDGPFDSICSKNVCINTIEYGEDDAAYRIFNVDYRDDKPFSILLTVVEVEEQKPAIITTESKANLLSQCAKF